MGMKSRPRLKEEAEEKKEAKLEKEAMPEEKEEKIVVKKWKGKDWFNILAPREFGAKLLGQSPATDPKSLIGRTMEVGAPEITGDNSKYYMKLNVRITNVEGKTCLTSFNGMECTRDHLLRMVRKRNQKVEIIVDVLTKDGWILRIKPWAILNGKPPTTVETKIRKMTSNFFNEFASSSNMNEMIKKILTTEIQMTLKKSGSKIYPIRFFEIARIKVLKSPEFHVSKPKPEEASSSAAEKPAEEKKEELNASKEKRTPKKQQKQKETKKKKQEEK